MARYFVRLPRYFAGASNLGGASTANMRAKVLAMRDAIRDVLDPDLLATNWLVSDITAWTATIYEGYAFTIFHRDGGANTGPAWTWFIPGSNGTTTVADPDDILEVAELNNYFRDTSGGTTFSSNGSPIIHYASAGGTTDPYDIGYNLADGTLVGGDFDSPTTNPRTDLATFMPAPELYGFCFDDVSETVEYSRMLMIADDEKPFIATYGTLGQETYPNALVLQGDFVVPYRPTDVFTNCSCSFEIDFNSANEGSRLNTTIYALNDAGSQISLTDYFNDAFTEFNVPFSDGTYPWDVIAIANASFYKGWFDSDVIRVLGAFDRDAFSLYDGGNFIKFDQYYGWPYAPNQVIWPTTPGSVLP